jgi:hypothetical protein
MIVVQLEGLVLHCIIVVNKSALASTLSCFRTTRLPNYSLRKATARIVLYNYVHLMSQLESIVPVHKNKSQNELDKMLRSVISHEVDLNTENLLQISRLSELTTNVLSQGFGFLSLYLSSVIRF